MEHVDTLLHARWIIPVEPDNTVYEHHSLAIKDGRIIERIDGAGGRPHLITQDESGALYLADAQSVEFERIKKR